MSSRLRVRSPRTGISVGCKFTSAFIGLMRFDASCITSIPGPPLSNETIFTELMKHGVNVALQVFDEPRARNTRFDAAWVRKLFSVHDAP